MSNDDRLLCAGAPVSAPIIALRDSTAQHSTAQHSTAQHSTAQHSTAQHSTAQHSTAQHSTAQHSTAPHLHVLLNPVQSHLGCNEVHDLIWEHHDRKPQQVEQRQGGKRHRGSQRIAKYGEGAKRSKGY